jgi:hypothetical protein
MKKIVREYLIGVTMSMTLAFGACAENQPSNNDEETSSATGETTVYYGVDNGAVLHNPLMGWHYTNFPENIAKNGIPEAFDLCAIWCSWDKMEPTKNGYDFSYVDQAVERLRKDGKTIFLKLYLAPDPVWGITGYPAWIKQEPGIGEFKPIYNADGSIYFEHTNYASPVWQGLVSKFLKQVAAHYKDGDVDIIDSRAYGICGEWDSNWSYYWDTTDPAYPANKTKVLNEIVNIYKDAFKDYKITKTAINVSSNGYATIEQARAYIVEAALDNAFDAGFAIRFDGVGDTDWWIGPGHAMQSVLKDYFPSSPVFCETWYGWNPVAYSVEGTYKNFLKVRSNGINYSFTQPYEYQRAIDYDPDFFINALRPNGDDTQIGYRILPVNIEYGKDGVVGGKIRFFSQWKNKGVGVLYRHYPLKLSLLAASGQEVFSKICDDFNITRLVKGEIYDYSTTLDLSVKPGEYKLQIALVDKNNSNRSAIRMPIGNADNKTADYVIGTVVVYPNESSDKN